MLLNYIFGFNARLGRLAYFFFSFVVGCGYLMLVFGITGNAPASGRTDVLLAQAANSMPLLIGFYVVLAMTFMLQSMRIRDIGWDPVCVMVGWIALVVIDRVVAGKYPEYALTYQHTGTTVGTLVNLALMLALTFWPGERLGEAPHETGDDGFSSRGSTPAAAGNRVARIASGEFGGKTR
ncbi:MULTISPECIES: DUF805 domain-containing protein [unclassified Bradyrhizobium]|uniref:DUF805 domain-containing protein n=1 Tax=unclassified Bradyrhizobium TaxID=2631580 RepID=UPI00041EFC48|nr:MULTISPECIES: DUF805 domain-containing protein [unclassified Bradyrhizobium]QIG96938.1 DUF805 domain-containing protein [Bradyrhizobium sp. 6(2017)]